MSLVNVTSSSLNGTGYNVSQLLKVMGENVPLTGRQAQKNRKIGILKVIERAR